MIAGAGGATRARGWLVTAVVETGWLSREERELDIEDQGCWQRRPRTSTAAASSVAPIARAPASPRTGISPKRNRRRRRPHHRAARAGREGAALDSAATTRQGIKNTISPAEKSGERARCRAVAAALVVWSFWTTPTTRAAGPGQGYGPLANLSCAHEQEANQDTS
jgi:hypothetical protein